MAAYSAQVAKTATLTSTTVDVVTLAPQNYASEKIVVVNWDETEDLWFTTNGPTPTDGGDNCFPVMPGTSTTLDCPSTAAVIVRLIGNGNKYTVAALVA